MNAVVEEWRLAEKEALTGPPPREAVKEGKESCPLV